MVSRVVTYALSLPLLFLLCEQKTLIFRAVRPRTFMSTKNSLKKLGLESYHIRAVKCKIERNCSWQAGLELTPNRLLEHKSVCEKVDSPLPLQEHNINV